MGRRLIHLTFTGTLTRASMVGPGQEGEKPTAPQRRRRQIPVDFGGELLQRYLIMARHPDIGHHLDDGQGIDVLNKVDSRPAARKNPFFSPIGFCGP
ncbi:MAG: hypothetical protein WCD80_04830 [Desulfobaccales bacterium]